MHEPDLSIAIVNWNSYDLVLDCVRSLRNTITDITYEVIVVDNSQNESERQKFARGLTADVQLVLNGENVGFAAANNQAFERARGRYLMMVNPDAEAMPGSVEGMIGLLEGNKTIGMLGCQLLNTDGSRQTSAYSTYPSALSAAIDVTGVLWCWRKFADWMRFENTSSAYRRVAWIKGACLMTRKEVIERIGMLDERFFLYSEDADWCKRAHDAGWIVAKSTRWSVMHHGQRSAGHAREASVRAYYDSYLKFVAKHGKTATGLQLAVTALLLRVSAFTRMVAFGLAWKHPLVPSRFRAYRSFLFSKSHRRIEFQDPPAPLVEVRDDAQAATGSERRMGMDGG